LCFDVPHPSPNVLITQRVVSPKEEYIELLKCYELVEISSTGNFEVMHLVCVEM